MNGKTGIYIRVSTEEQAKDGFSIHAQKEKLTKYADLNDWDVYDFYIDDGISGKNISDRPEAKRLLKNIEEQKISNVLIYKLDRLTRSMKDLIYLIDFFESQNCSFNSQTEKIDTSNAVGRMFVKIIGIFAEFERENLAERVSFGYEQKTREGNYTNTNGVYGYDYIIGKKKLEINDFEKDLVNKIFELYLEGMSYYKIAEKLDNLGVPTKRGGHWASATIKSIINNPLYIGKVRYGVNNKHKSFEVSGLDIPTIISKELWNKVHNIIKTRKKYSQRRFPSDSSYFFHIIKCARCGENIVAKKQIQNNKVYITYKCNNASGQCNCEGFSHIKMEKAFIDYLSNINRIKPSKDIFNNKQKTNDQQKNDDYYKDKLQKLINKKEIIRKNFINDILSNEEYQNLIKEINKKEKNFQEEIKALEKAKYKNDDISLEKVQNIIGNIKLNWNYLLNKERQQFLMMYVEYISVDKINDKVLIKDLKFKEN